MQVAEVDFWRAVSARRNAFYWWFAAWVPGGFLVSLLYRSITGEGPNSYFLFFLLASWWLIGIVFQSRLLALVCPRCNEKALKHGFFFMKDAHCQHCGLGRES
jgi:hypothetical protein